MPTHSLSICTAIILLAFSCVMAQAAGSVTALVQCDPDQNLIAHATVKVSSMAGSAGRQYSASGIADNDMGTLWATAQNAKLPQWIEVTFPEPTTLDTIVFIPRDFPDMYFNAKTVEITFSDGDPVTAQPEDRAGAHLIKFPPHSVTSFRFTITAGWSENMYFGLHEFMAFNDPEGRVGLVGTPIQGWKQMKLEERGRETHPCVYATPEDIARARKNVTQYEWAADYTKSVIARADKVVDKDPQWIHDTCPDKGAAFACGKTGCPICGGKYAIVGGWGGWTSAKCDWNRPGTVLCENGHLLPDAEHPDEGTGYVAEDGRIHYFVGTWNAFVVEHYISWATDLALAYSLTGDDKYAATCAVILDALAEIYPSCTKGSWDYPSNPPSGRLARPWYQAARALVPMVSAYDQIYNSPSLDAPSFTEGMNRHQNIETNMFKDGAWYCYQQSLKGGLNNGEADYIRGALAVGCLLGIDQYIDWALDGPYGIRAMLFNNADRDGRYVETALGYALHSRNLYITFAEPLINYRSEQYPEGINLYDEDAFRSFYVLPRLSVLLAGHSPRYGDEGPDTSRLYPPSRLYDALDYTYAERIAIRSTIPEVKEAFGTLVHSFAGDDLDKLRASANHRDWLIFHAAEIPGAGSEIPERLQRIITGSYNMGQKGMAILRTPNSSQAQACLFRYGPVLNHGHADDLGINYVGAGYDLTYDLGYGSGSTNTQVGWSKQTASHQLVLINETPQNATAADFSGGDLHSFAAMPGLQLADADADDVYKSQGVEQYRRCLALVGDGPESYLLDIFSVRGGSQHDYMAHSLSEDMTIDGVQLGDAAEGSVAGPEFNWGERQTADGYLTGTERRIYWNPPPENGLGFMMNPRRGSTDENWAATWALPDGKSFMRMTMLGDTNTEVIRSWATGIYPNYPKAAHVIARRIVDTGDPQSTFITIREPYTAEGSISRGIEATDLMDVASTEDGMLKYLGGYGLVLFQATDPGGEVHFDLTVPAAGAYYLHVSPYTSPAYGTVQFMIDEQPIGQPFNGNAPTVELAPTQIYGPVQLDAGKHRVSARTLTSDEGDPWIGIAALQLTTTKNTEAAEAAPFIASAKRLGATEGCSAFEISHQSGDIDRFIYAPTPGQADADDLQLDGSFGHIRGGRAVSTAHLVGKSLAASGFSMKLKNASHTGAIVRIDYDRNLVYVDADLPTDGRLNYQTVKFSNPEYSRNSSYTIQRVYKDGELSVLDMGTQRIILGRGTVAAPPEPTKLISLTPHEYVSKHAGNFFDGKLLRTADGSAETTIVTATFGQPAEVDVASSVGFSEGDLFYYMDLQVGDEFTIDNWAALTVTADGQLSVKATDDVEITLDGATTQFPWSN